MSPAIRVEVGREPLDHVGNLLRRLERQAARSDELWVTAAVEKGGRQPAGERFEERVRARVVSTRGEVDVVLSEEPRDPVGVDRPNVADLLERLAVPVRRT